MSVGIVFLPVLILIVLVIGALVYFLCYKAAINRKIRREESGAHVPMASTESVFKVVVIIGVLVLYGSLNSKLENLRREVNNTRTQLSDKINQLQYELHQMKEDAEKEASMIGGAYYEFGEVDTKEHKAELTFSVAPKSYSETTEVSVVFRGETIALTRTGGKSFTGSTTVSLFDENFEDCIICITDGGVTKTEVWEAALQGAAYWECLPLMVVVNSSFGSQSKKDGVRVNGDIEIVSSETKKPSFRNLTLNVKKGNTVIDELAMENGYVSLDRSYPLEEGEALAFYVRGVDEYGYIHENHVFGWNAGERTGDVVYGTFTNPGYQVYAPDGSILMK